MSQDETVKVDAIVVGGGPAGLAAAYTMAKKGLEVIVIERGEYAGAKNVGGLLYGTVLDQMMPKFYEKAPIERTVSKRSISFLDEDQQLQLWFGAKRWNEAPFNNTFIVYRSQFDRWFAKQVEEAGASLLEGTVAESLIFDGAGDERKVIGVKVRGDEKFLADVVILCDGANALMTEKARAELKMKPGKHKQEWAVGVKEIIGLRREKIEDRFNLEGNEGAALDYIGSPFEGMIGGGFIYTGKESIHVGFAAKMETLAATGLKPNEAMQRFKTHPVVRKLLAGGDLLEYSAHLLPEGGYDAIGQLVANGVLIAGDAAGLLNASLYKEGTNHAMESGRAAGETAIEAKERKDFSRAGLALYEEKMKASVAMADLKKVRKLPQLLESTPQLMSLYPRKVTSLLCDFFSVASESKKETQKRAMKKFFEGVSKFALLRDGIRARNIV